MTFWLNHMWHQVELSIRLLYDLSLEWYWLIRHRDSVRVIAVATDGWAALRVPIGVWGLMILHLIIAAQVAVFAEVLVNLIFLWVRLLKEKLILGSGNIAWLHLRWNARWWSSWLAQRTQGAGLLLEWSIQQLLKVTKRHKLIRIPWSSKGSYGANN